MNNFIFKKYVQFIERHGYFPIIFNPYNCSEIIDISPTLTAQCGDKCSSATILISNLGGGEMNKSGIIVLGNYSPSGHDASRIVDENGVAPTVKENHGTVTAVATEGRSMNKDIDPVMVGGIGEINFGKQYRQGNRIYDANSIAMALLSSPAGNAGGYSYLYAIGGADMNNEPFIVASRGRNPENPSDRTTGSPTEQRLEPNTKGLCNTLTTVQKDNLVAEPVNPMPDGTCRTIKNQYYKTSQANYERTGSMGATGVNTGLRIRKLTPKECFRLMGFDDEDFYKAKWMKNLSYLVGGRKCSAKLKVVKEKQKLTDTETYVLCTTRDSRDMETLRTILKSSVDKQENENQANVNIAIEWLDGMEHSECATNIIRCIDCMGMHFIMITGKEPQATDIIVQARVDNTSTGRFMKITTESNLNQSKLYTILTLFALIIESKIFTAATQQANINGCITLIEDCEKNVLMKISNLRMESIRERTSNSALYKQAGNSIVVDVLEALFTNLRPYLEG